MLITRKKELNILIINATYNSKPCNIAIKNGKIDGIFKGEIMPKERFDEIIDAKGKIIVPGLIDVHCHGCIGLEATDGEQALKDTSLRWAQEGVTSWYPTGATIPISDIRKSFASLIETEGANIVFFRDGNGIILILVHILLPLRSAGFSSFRLSAHLTAQVTESV